MLDDLVDKTVVLRMNKNFMKFVNLNYPCILRQRFPTFQVWYCHFRRWQRARWCRDGLRIDIYMYLCIHDILYIHDIHVHVYIWIKIAFIITHKRNNVVVSFGSLKVQSFMLTEVRDCDLLIVVISSTFLKRKDTLKEKRQLAQIIKARSPAYI